MTPKGFPDTHLSEACLHPARDDAAQIDGGDQQEHEDEKQYINPVARLIIHIERVVAQPQLPMGEECCLRGKILPVLAARFQFPWCCILSVLDRLR